jgi:hypothetical protein
MYVEHRASAREWGASSLHSIKEIGDRGAVICIETGTISAVIGTVSIIFNRR